MMRYPNVIFDFDGTLSDSYPTFTQVFIDILHRCGLDDSYENVYRYMKQSVGYCFAQYPLHMTAAEFSADFHRLHDECAVRCQKPIEGARELLEFIKDNGGKNFIFTHSGQTVYDLVDAWGWRELFSGFVDSTSKVARKPSPEGVYVLLDRYGLDKKETIIVGDRDIDVGSGTNAGIATCLFDFEHYYDDAAVDYRINALCELKDVIK